MPTGRMQRGFFLLTFLLESSRFFSQKLYHGRMTTLGSQLQRGPAVVIAR